MDVSPSPDPQPAPLTARPRWFTRRDWLLFWLIVGGLNGLFLVMHLFTMSRWGGTRTSDIETLHFLLGFIAAIFALCSLIGLLFPSSRARARKYLLIAIPFMALMIAVFFAGDWLRHQAVLDLIERSKPLVEALNLYTRDHGAPPELLQQLVPDYLPAVPSTGLSSKRQFSLASPAKHHGNPWVLRVNMPSGFLQFDYLLYYPLQNYPETNESGWLQRIGTWAYVHE